MNKLLKILALFTIFSVPVFSDYMNCYKPELPLKNRATGYCKDFKSDSIYGSHLYENIYNTSSKISYRKIDYPYGKIEYNIHFQKLRQLTLAPIISPKINGQYVYEGSLIKWEAISPVNPIKEDKSHFWPFFFFGGYQMRIYHRQLEDGSNPLGKMDEPVIISQGFDPEFNTSGQNNMKKFESSNMPLIEDLLTQGKSVVLLMYARPTDGININSYFAYKAMKKVQEWAPDKDLNLIGPSMGGLIFRHALIGISFLEDQGGLNLKNFIAYDSPNWGAVMPMSIQATMKYASSQGGKDARLYENLNSLAARQMLLTRVKPRRSRRAHHTVDGYFVDNNEKLLDGTASNFLINLNSWYNWRLLRTLRSRSGDTIKLTALAEGTRDTYQGIQEDKEWAKVEDMEFYLRLSTHKPNTMTHIATLDAANKYSWRYYFKEPVFLENVPGSYVSGYSQLNDGISKWGGVTDGKVVNLSSNSGNSFIPTASAFGKKMLYYSDFNKKEGWLVPEGTETLFDQAYILAPNSNLGHLSIDHKNTSIRSTIINKIRTILND